MKKIIKIIHTNLTTKVLRSKICVLTRYSSIKTPYVKLIIKLNISYVNVDTLVFDLGKPCILDLTNKYEVIFYRDYLINNYKNLRENLNENYDQCFLSIEYLVQNKNQHEKFVKSHLTNLPSNYFIGKYDFLENLSDHYTWKEVPVRSFSSNKVKKFISKYIGEIKNVFSYDYLHIQSKVWLGKRVMTFPIGEIVKLDLNNKKDIESYLNYLVEIVENKFNPTLNLKPTELLANVRKSNVLEYRAYHLYKNIANNCKFSYGK